MARAKSTGTTTRTRKATATKATGTKAKSTALATKSQFTVDDVPEMLSRVEEQIKAIKGNLPEEVKTTGSLTNYGRIEDINKLGDLIMAYASVEAREEAYKKAASKVVPTGFKAPTFKLDGHTPNEWYSDIQARAVIVANKARLDKLEATKKQLSQFVSEEEKLSNTLRDIQSSFEAEIE